MEIQHEQSYDVHIMFTFVRAHHVQYKHMNSLAMLMKHRLNIPNRIGCLYLQSNFAILLPYSIS